MAFGRLRKFAAVGFDGGDALRGIGFVFSRDIGSVLTGTVFASLPLLGMALAQTFAIAIVSLQINRKKTLIFILKTGCPRFRRPVVDETSY